MACLTSPLRRPPNPHPPPLFYACTYSPPLKVVENREGSRWTPACVAFKGGGDPIIGSIARAQRFEVRTKDQPAFEVSSPSLLACPGLACPFLFSSLFRRACCKFRAPRTHSSQNSGRFHVARRSGGIRRQRPLGRSQKPLAVAGAREGLGTALNRGMGRNRGGGSPTRMNRRGKQAFGTEQPRCPGGLIAASPLLHSKL